MKVVITGINGFVGHHLARELKNNGAWVIGVGSEETPSSRFDGAIDEYFSANLINEWPRIESIDSVVHLAGLAAVGPSFDSPQKYINGNSAMLTNMCEFYLNQEIKPRIVVVSSGAIYDSNQPMPIGEKGVVGFNSPYAVSKILTENQCMYYRNRGLDCVVVRPFNHIGPGQAEGFILPDFYAQLNSIKGTGDKMKVGNIKTRRDYTDVRDIVRAYTKIALTPELQNTLYNICSGKSLSGDEILDYLKQSMNTGFVDVEIDPSKVRPTDIMNIAGDSTRLQNELGWTPEIPISQTIADFVASKNL